MARVSIQIVAWNSMRYLPEALASIMAQTFTDFSVIVVDNASTDKVMDFLQNEHPKVATIRNANNRGFACAHNQAIELAKRLWRREDRIPNPEDKLVLVTNPDIILEPDFLEKLVVSVDEHQEAGSFAPKLKKVFSRMGVDEQDEAVKSSTIDSTGLMIRRSRAVVDRGSGVEDGSAYSQSGPVFGASGALACYRLAALEAACVDGEYFDEDFFAYKEDVDLAWRLQTLRIPCHYVADAEAYHYRYAAGGESRSLFQVARERNQRSKLVNLYSTRNHWLTLLKNDSSSALFRHSYRFVPYEFIKLLYLLFREPSSLAAIPAAMRLSGKMREKRAQIRELAKDRGGIKSIKEWLV